MTVRGTVLLWAAVAALGLYVWYAELGSRASAPPRRPDVAEAPSGPPLLSFRSEDVEAVEITDAADGGLRLRRVATGWQGAAQQAPPEPELVATLLDALAALRALYVVDAAPDRPGDYGLDPPRREIRVSVRGSAEPLVLALGERNPSWTGVYAQVGGGGGPVVMVGAVILWEVERVLRDDRSPGR